MLYRKDRYGKPLSQLGFGCMRFTKKGNEIDLEKAKAEVLRAVELGVNYFDTAYAYPGNEICLGKIVNDLGIRDQIHIATKLPQYIVRKPESIEKIFREELERLQTDYIDYYLMHMMTDYAEWEHLKALGIEEWIAGRKAEGSIRQVGFSYHGDTEMFLKLLNAYDWDFCQIQYNYLDVSSQAGAEGLQAAYRKGIPVIIMEPLRGGKLVELPTKALERLSAYGRDTGKCYTPAELGLRWLWNQEGVTTVLSGMNSLDMVEENVRIASNAEPGCFDEKDLHLVDEIRSIIKEKEKVGCTGCRYCMPCPMGVDIPGNFYYYNLMYMEKKGSARFGFAQVMGMRENPGFATLCVGCGKCEQHCPQHLPIREKLKEADRNLRPLPYRIGINAARKMMKLKK